MPPRRGTPPTGRACPGSTFGANNAPGVVNATELAHRDPLAGLRQPIARTRISQNPVSLISVQVCVTVNLSSACIQRAARPPPGTGVFSWLATRGAAEPHEAKLSIATGRRRQSLALSDLDRPAIARPGAALGRSARLGCVTGHIHRGCPPDPDAHCGDCGCDDNRGEGPAPLGMLTIHTGQPGGAITCGRHGRRLYCSAAEHTQ